MYVCSSCRCSYTYHGILRSSVKNFSHTCSPCPWFSSINSGSFCIDSRFVRFVWYSHYLRKCVPRQRTHASSIVCRAIQFQVMATMQAICRLCHWRDQQYFVVLIWQTSVDFPRRSLIDARNGIISDIFGCLNVFLVLN